MDLCFDAFLNAGDKATVTAWHSNLDIERYKADQAVVLHKAN